MSASHGQKVTTDPASNNQVREGAGTITSDSLAGESIASGGAFASKNPGVGSTAQSSGSTTTNNTDTSSATTLQPAPDAEARDASQGWSETSQLNAGRELGSGAGPTYSGANTGSSSSSSGGQSYSGAAGGSSGGSTGGSSGGSAPNYVNNPASSMGDDFKPKGQNISEGGFDSSAPNASFNSDIGGKNDPGRAALQGMQRADAQAGGDASGSGQRQSGVTNDGQYDILKDAEA